MRTTRKESLAGAIIQDFFQALQLLGADATDREQRQARHRRRHADQRQRPAPPQEREVGFDRARRVAAHVVAPVLLRRRDAAAHIGVVIARHQGHVGGRAERIEPGARRRVFVRQRQIDEVAGDRDVVRRLRLEIGDDAREHVRPVDRFALAPPVDEAGRALADQLDKPRLRQRRKMRIRQMRQYECHREIYELPIRMPARNTSVPPSTTWNAAERNGVSM